MSSVIALVVGGLVIALDQLTKYLVANNFTTDMAPVSLLGGLFNLHYTENGGAQGGSDGNVYDADYKDVD